MTNLPFTVYLSLTLSVVSIAIGLSFWNKGPLVLRILTVYFIVGFITGIAMTVLAANSKNNLWLMHIYTPIQFSLLIWLFSAWTQGTLKRTLFFSLPGFLSFWIIMLFFFESFDRFSTYTRPVEALLLIMVSGYIVVQTNKEQNESILKVPKFWVASGTMVYFSGMILLYAVSNLWLTIAPETLGVVWISIQTVANTVSTLMYITAFLCQSPRLQPQP